MEVWVQNQKPTLTSKFFSYGPPSPLPALAHKHLIWAKKPYWGQEELSERFSVHVDAQRIRQDQCTGLQAPLRTGTVIETEHPQNPT